MYQVAVEQERAFSFQYKPFSGADLAGALIGINNQSNNEEWHYEKRILFILASVVLSIAGFALAHEDVKNFPSCKYCGMNREKFAYSRTLVTYDDRTLFGACSIHCLAIDLVVNIDKAPAKIEVGDYNSKQLVDAEKAFWVIGGSKPGIMTKQGQWAFTQKVEAEAFIKDNGGVIATFEEVMKAAYESMYTDTKRIREKRKLRKLGHN